MFTNSDFKITFGLTIKGSIAATSFLYYNKSWKQFILGNLSLKVKKLLTHKGDVKNNF